MATSFGAVQSSTANPTDATAAQTAPTDSANGLGNENAFLTLLVAQLKYQDPEQPADSTQFVTQLAQFSDLEQQIGSHQDLNGILAAVSGSTPTDSTGGASTGSPALPTLTPPPVALPDPGALTP